MRTTQLKNISVITMLLSSIVLLTLFSAAALDKTSTTMTKNSAPEYLLKKTLLFGRVQNLTVEGNYTTVEPVNLRILFFKPFQLFHYTTGEPLTFATQDHGIQTDSFLMGSFTVVLPINTNSLAVMNTTLGTIIIELFEDKTPITAGNFINLTNIGFYNGLVFHRVIKDFVIQGGGYYPNGTEKISPYGPIDLEINPSVHHLDGTIGMARTSNPNSATSQFFIDDGAQPQLEPNGSDPNGYAAFGRVVKGIDVVRAIAQVETMTKYGFMDDWPVNDVIIERVTIVTKT